MSSLLIKTIDIKIFEDVLISLKITLLFLSCFLNICLKNVEKFQLMFTFIPIQCNKLQIYFSQKVATSASSFIPILPPPKYLMIRDRRWMPVVLKWASDSGPVFTYCQLLAIHRVNLLKISINIIIGRSINMSNLRFHISGGSNHKTW